MDNDPTLLRKSRLSMEGHSHYRGNSRILSHPFHCRLTSLALKPPWELTISESELLLCFLWHVNHAPHVCSPVAYAGTRHRWSTLVQGANNLICPNGFSVAFMCDVLLRILVLYKTWALSLFAPTSNKSQSSSRLLNLHCNKWHLSRTAVLSSRNVQ